MSDDPPAPASLPPARLDAFVARINRGFESGEIRQLNLSTFAGELPPASYSTEIAAIKRVIERWSTDVEFRDLASQDLEAAVASLGLDGSVDPAALEYLWDDDVALSTAVEDVPLQALRYRAFSFEKITHCNQLRVSHPSMHPWFRGWRERQMQRASQQLPPLTASRIVHAPFAVELCNGCSVGCWFCGVSAPKLGDVFAYTPDNAALFGAMLDALTEVFGEATDRGFCYWATDPFDNPDYERFLADFHAHTGTLPQTTTALALRDLDRTRALLARTFEVRGVLNRFSLLSLKQILRVHQEFTPEELLFTELVAQNRESRMAKARSGRALTGKPKQAGPAAPGNTVFDSTIACVTGFLINLVNRELRLISPCTADADHPLGYITFDEARFDDATQLRDEIQRMVHTHMRPGLPDETEVGFPSYISVRDEPEQLSLHGPYLRTQLRLGSVGDEVIRVLGTSTWRVGDLLDRVGASDLARESSALLALERLHDLGFLSTRRPSPSRDPSLVALRT